MHRAFTFQALLFGALLVCTFAFPSFAQPPAGPGGFVSTDERIGGLRLGQSEFEAAKAVSCQPKKLKEIREEATAEYVQTWRFEGCGVELKMGSAKKGGAKIVESVIVTAPCALPTARGIKIGSTEQEVLKAYGRFRDEDGATEKGKTFVAGSIYDGMIFTFNNGKVVRIFLGAAAE